MNNANLSHSQLSNFYSSLLELDNTLKFSNLSNDKKLLEVLFQSSVHKSNKAIQRVEIQGLNYNLFSIMRYGNYETKLHTPFLYNLLDPIGSHGLGDFFFKKINQ